MNLNPRIKNILWGLFAIVVGVAGLVWILASPRPNHIEDTNGADNYSLQTISEQDVVEQKVGSRGVVGESEIHLDLVWNGLSSGRKYSSSKFTGVNMLYTETIFKGSDIHVILAECKVKEGNFAFYIVFDGEVVGKIQPDADGGTAEFLLENVEKTGAVEYVIAGESANFSFIPLTDFH